MRLRGAGAKQGSTVAFFPVKQRDSGDFLTLGQAGGQQTDLGARSSAELGFIRMTSKLRMGVVFLKDCLKKKKKKQERRMCNRDRLWPEIPEMFIIQLYRESFSVWS